MEISNQEINQSSFVHLHVHGETSMQDSVAKISDIIKKAKENNMKAVALTDHGVMHGVINFYNECKKNNIKPLLGCELYVAPNSRFEKDKNNKYYHLVVIAKDYEGYINLCKLSSRGFTEGFYSKPRVDKELLKEFSNGLICLSACISGEVPKLIIHDEYEKAKEVALEYQSIFGKENFFIEVQNHGIPEELKVNKEIVKIANEIGAKIVATNDIHYINREDSEVQDVLKCISDKKQIDDPTRRRFYNDEFYFKSEKEMSVLFPNNPEFITNTSIIADMCNVELEFGKIHLPKYPFPSIFNTNFDYLKDMAMKGLIERYGENVSEDYKKRLNYELNVINQMGFVDYFLIVWDYINFAREAKIKVGPGRGSGAGSMVAYCIKITSIDPMKYNLIFERFLNPERISLPDFDIDFEPDRRNEIFDYLTSKYGINNCSKVLAIQTMKAKNAIRDTAKVYGIIYSESQKWSNMIPNDDPNITLDEVLSTSAEFQNLYRSNNDAKKIIDIARKLEGLPRQASSHAAGVIIADKPIENYAPIMTAENKKTKETYVVVQFSKKLLEPLGLIKMDLLGLRNLTLLNNAEKQIRKTKNPNFSIDDVNYEDSKVYNHLCEPNGTIGVFQLESGGITKATVQLKPNCFEDIIALIALYRPGPMDNIPTYVKNKHNSNAIQYIDDRLSPILDVTYGVIIYQEQVMQIYRDFAGFSMGRSDIVRKAMSNKDRSILDKENNIFKYGLKDENGNYQIKGALNNGFKEDVIDTLIADMESFASYAFNKSHSAAYADVSYKTAYMMTYYPKEYYAEILTSVIGNNKKLGHYISIAKNTLKFNVLPPNINKSSKGFTVIEEDILFGLEGLNNVGTVFVDNLIEERDKNGDFKNIYDFVCRMHPLSLDTASLNSLIQSGALDCFGFNRQTLLSYASSLLDFATKIDKYTKLNLPTIFDSFDNSEKIKINYIYPKIQIRDEYPFLKLLHYEFESMGIYISGNPLNEYSTALSKIKVNSYDDIVMNVTDQTNVYHDKEPVCFAVIITRIEEKITKRTKEKMAILTVNDGNDEFEIVVYSKAYTYYDFLFETGNAILLKGRLLFDTYDEESIKCKFDANKFLLIPNNSSSKDDFMRFRKATKPFRIYKKVKENRIPDYAIPPETSEKYHYQRGLYVRCQNLEQVKKIMKLFVSRKSFGSYYVYLYNQEENKIYRSTYTRFNPMDYEIVELLKEQNINSEDIKFYIN